MLSCVWLCDPVDCSLLGSPVHEDSRGKNNGVGCHALLQGIFPTQTWIEPRSPTLQVYSLLSEPPDEPMSTGVGSLSLLQDINKYVYRQICITCICICVCVYIYIHINKNLHIDKTYTVKKLKASVLTVHNSYSWGVGVGKMDGREKRGAF